MNLPEGTRHMQRRDTSSGSMSKLRRAREKILQLFHPSDLLRISQSQQGPRTRIQIQSSIVQSHSQKEREVMPSVGINTPRNRYTQDRRRKNGFRWCGRTDED